MPSDRYRAAAALFAAAALAGCGSSHKLIRTSAGVNTPAASIRNKAASTCKANIASQSHLASGSKNALEAICAVAAENNGSALRRQEALACQALVKSTVPSANQATALASCPKQ